MKTIWRSIAILIVVSLSACGGQPEPTPTPIDPIMLVTAAVQTVSAEKTRTALAMPTATQTPTPEPSPTLIELTVPPIAAETSAFDTPLPAFATANPLLASPTALSFVTPGGALCDNSAFVADITIPDGTKVKPEEQFKKIWRIQNTGTCTWDDGYALVYAYGDSRLDGNGWAIKSKAEFTKPGEVLDVGMMMTAPKKPGAYGSCWQMRNDRGVIFGTAVCVAIEVTK
jgi:hypothetical protein